MLGKWMRELFTFLIEVSVLVVKPGAMIFISQSRVK